MPMTPRSNSLSMSAGAIFACSSISRTSGRISRFRELVDAVAEETLVFGERGQRLCADFGILRRHRSVSTADVTIPPIAASRCNPEPCLDGCRPGRALREPQRPEKRLRLGMASRMRTVISAGAALLLVLGTAGHAQQATTAATAAGAAAAAAAAADAAGSPAATADLPRRASISSASTSSSPTTRAIRSPTCSRATSRSPRTASRRRSRPSSWSSSTAAPPNRSRTPPREIRNDYDEEMEAARDDVRLFAIFLDDYHVRRGASLSVRNPLMTFIENKLGPSDMIGVMYPLESTASVRMTRNHSAVMRGLAAVPGAQVRLRAAGTSTSRPTRTIPTEIVEKIRNQVSLSAIKALIVHMGSLKEGRKALILVSEGYTSILPPQMRNADATMPGSGNPAARNPMAGRERSERGSCVVDRRARHGLRPARGLRRGQPEQRRDLRRRSARPSRLRVRHQRRHRPPDRFQST